MSEAFFFTTNRLINWDEIDADEFFKVFTLRLSFSSVFVLYSVLLKHEQLDLRGVNVWRSKTKWQETKRFTHNCRLKSARCTQ